MRWIMYGMWLIAKNGAIFHNTFLNVLWQRYFVVNWKASTLIKNQQMSNTNWKGWFEDSWQTITSKHSPELQFYMYQNPDMVLKMERVHAIPERVAMAFDRGSILQRIKRELHA